MLSIEMAGLIYPNIDKSGNQMIKARLSSSFVTWGPVSPHITHTHTYIYIYIYIYYNKVIQVEEEIYWEVNSTL